MLLSEKITEAFKNSEEKGFHKLWTPEQMIMLVITELSEAIEADREGKICTKETFDYFQNRCKEIGKFSHVSFKNNIKDTREDEIADAAIRLFDLIGLSYKENFYKHIDDLFKHAESVNYYPDETLAHNFYYITKAILAFPAHKYTLMHYAFMLKSIFNLGIMLKFDLEQHIIWKMEYNTNHRGHLHGKKY